MNDIHCDLNKTSEVFRSSSPEYADEEVVIVYIYEELVFKVRKDVKLTAYRLK